MASIWITSILSIIFIIVGTLLVLNWVFPVLRRVLDGLSENSPMVGRGILTLLIIYVYFLALSKIIEFLKAIGNSTLNYADLLTPGVTVVLNVYDLLKWVIIGLVISLAFLNSPSRKKK